MKLTCLSKGGGFHFPPCYILNVWGFQILLDCPIDLSALTIFSPIPSDSCRTIDDEFSDCSPQKFSIPDLGDQKRQKIEKPLEANDLICAEPWYKTVNNLHLWDVSFIDIVLISSPMGMLGLPFLTRNKDFSAKIYVTEATVRLGQLMMEDLVSMHMEFRQFYGPGESSFPQWMKWEELEMLPLALREIALGKDASELGSWLPLYSVTDVKDCVQKVKALKYAEEACYNGTLIIKAFSSGLEIGTSNWTIKGPRRNIACLSSSIFESAHAMNFDYHSLQGNDLILFSDFSSLHGTTGVCKESDGSSNLHACQASTAYDCLSPRDGNGNGEGFMKSLSNSDESLEEMEKLAFVCSCAIDSVKEGGSVLIPIGRLGIVLQLVEQMSLSLESSNLKVPIFIISTIAEEILAFTNVVPEWLCKQRQQKLYSGEPLFAHVELIKDKKLHLFPAVYSPNLLVTWQEPCIVFSPHWSLRLGPVVHLLQRWCGDQNCLLVLEQGVDADLALLPFKPMKMKVLQCSFLCGIKLQKVQPLLEMLQPKFVLFPEELRLQILSSNTLLSSFLYYSENETLRVPRLRDFFEADLAFQLQPTRMREENKCIARLKGELFIEHSKHLLVLGNERVDSSQSRPLLHWGSLDLNLLVKRLREKGINGSVDQSRSDVGSLNTCLVHVYEPNKALIEIRAMSTIISAADETLASLIFEAVSSVLDGI